ncbi:MAG: 3-oxoacyl-[acyl-carrier-protein] reductase [Candidatus Delongbacteria bacterium]|nr:3-oxoacyl-[acyl-carrier-protein] reductase [Candidatus Delongbacteria bacterium]MBN2837016.1 3-oxoacyl-[acyl-carrier-protein] reductase [Candidatus Delongbacteria bacterium]
MVKDKVVIVTGSARGIGKAIAQELLESGAKVVISDVMEEVMNETVKEFTDKGMDAIGIKCDVSNPTSAEELVNKTIEHFGRIDILVNNAGVTRDNLIMRMSESDWDLVININLKGVFNTTKAVTRPMMKQRYGRIINISSVVGEIGNAGQLNYSASKAGVIGMTKTTAKELATRGITANAVAPGFIVTEMTHKLTDQAREMLSQQIPSKQLGQPSDIAKAVKFLASDDASYITGQVLNVDGGMVM